MDMIWIIIGIAAIVGFLVLVFTQLYVKTPPHLAFIRTGLGGRKVVIDGGAIVLPIVQDIQWISLETFKLEVFKSGREAFITKDKLRVDIGAEFYVKVEPTVESIENASRSLGEKSFSGDGIKALVEEKLISALRAVAATMNMVELHENRHKFEKEVMESLKDALARNGLTLENVSVFYLDQTDKNYFDPNNIFDAEGLRQITAQTSARMKERNEIERNTEVAIKQKDVEAFKLKLQLDRDKAFAEADQNYQIETYKSKRYAEIEQFKAEQERIANEARIRKDKAIREAEIQSEASIIKQAQMKEIAEIEKQKAIEESKRDVEIAVILKEKQKIEAESKKLETRALEEEARQKIITVEEKARAERDREIALIEALRELEVAQKRAKAVEFLASSKVKEGEAEAYVRAKKLEAENVLSDKIVNRDILLNLIEKSPEILNQLMAPAKNIEGIKVLSISGLNSGAAQSAGLGILNAILSAGATLPLLREFMEFAKIDKKIIDKIAEYIPGIASSIKEKENGEKV
jgi:uncharacterized membrane protein YqiK